MGLYADLSEWKMPSEIFSPVPSFSSEDTEARSKAESSAMPASELAAMWPWKPGLPTPASCSIHYSMLPLSALLLWFPEREAGEGAWTWNTGECLCLYIHYGRRYLGQTQLNDNVLFLDLVLAEWLVLRHPGPCSQTFSLPTLPTVTHWRHAIPCVHAKTLLWNH